jgi:H+/Cl- antiporter ClcA
MYVVLKLLHVLAALLAASHWFDERLVIPSFFGVFVTGLLAAWIGGTPWTLGGRPSWMLVALILLLLPTPLIPAVLVPRRRQREVALREAVAAGRITPGLRAALDDSGVIGRGQWRRFSSRRSWG